MLTNANINTLLPKRKPLFAWSKMFFDPEKWDSSPAIQRDWQDRFNDRSKGFPFGQQPVQG
jgi:hypothetical protein